jgi:hypothetical protein
MSRSNSVKGDGVIMNMSMSSALNSKNNKAPKAINKEKVININNVQPKITHNISKRSITPIPIKRPIKTAKVSSSNTSILKLDYKKKPEIIMKSLHSSNNSSREGSKVLTKNKIHQLNAHIITQLSQRATSNHTRPKYERFLRNSTF